MSAANDRGDSGAHIGELAELYALGVLEPQEFGSIDAHIAGCAGCARALGDAEATVAALGDAFVPQLEPPERLGSRIAASAQSVAPFSPRAATAARRARPPGVAPGLLATAAALLLAVGVGGGALVERSADVREAARDSSVLATLATSHFNHVSLVSHTTSAPAAKVLYGRDGAWFYVVVDSATCDCRVIAASRAGRHDLGKPEVRGTTATLFVRNIPRPISLDLVDASGSVIAGAPLVYPAR